MDMKDKKEHILRLIKLGMTLYKASLIMECDDEEIKSMEEDEQFIRTIAAHEAIGEKELLDKLEDAIDMGLDKGKSAAIQWKLERLHPERWGSKEVAKENMNPNLTIELVGRHKSDKDN